MHRKFVFILLIIHLFFMSLVVSYNCKFDFSHKGMFIAYLLLFYTGSIFVYLKFKKLYPLTVAGSLIYLLLNTAVFTFFIFSQLSVLKATDVIMFVLAFVPGIYSALVCTVYLIRDGKLKRSLA